VSESERPKSEESAPSSPDDLVKDLDIQVSKADEEAVVGGRKAGKGQQEYLVVKMNDVIIT
jgi:hypothetical protein